MIAAIIALTAAAGANLAAIIALRGEVDRLTDAVEMLGRQAAADRAMARTFGRANPLEEP